MAVYHVITPKGDRLIEARTPSAAINHAVKDDGYQATSLNPSELAAWARKGITIEQVLTESKVA